MHRDEPIRPDRPVHAFWGDSRGGLDVDDVPDQGVGRLGDQHLERRRVLLHRGRDRHRVAGQHVLTGGRLADDDVAAAHPGARDQPHAPRPLELVVESVEHRHALGCRLDRAHGVVGARRGDAEGGHDGVADDLLDGAAVRLENEPHLVEVAGQQLAERLGVEPLPKARRALQVGVDDRDGATDLRCHQPSLRRRRQSPRKVMPDVERTTSGIAHNEGLISGSPGRPEASGTCRPGRQRCCPRSQGCMATRGSSCWRSRAAGPCTRSSPKYRSDRRFLERLCSMLLDRAGRSYRCGLGTAQVTCSRPGTSRPRSRALPGRSTCR